MGIDKSVLLKLLNKDKYGLGRQSLIVIDKLFVHLINHPKFECKILLDNYFVDINEKTSYFNLTSSPPE
jgi:hypothetical protein